MQMSETRVRDSKTESEKRTAHAMQLILNMMVIAGSVSPIGLTASLVTHGARAATDLPIFLFSLSKLVNESHKSQASQNRNKINLFESGANITTHGLQIGLLIGTLAFCASVTTPLLPVLAAYCVFSLLLSFAAEKLKEKVLTDYFDVNYTEQPPSPKFAF